MESHVAPTGGKNLSWADFISGQKSFGRKAGIRIPTQSGQSAPEFLKLQNEIHKSK